MHASLLRRSELANIEKTAGRGDECALTGDSLVNNPPEAANISLSICVWGIPAHSVRMNQLHDQVFEGTDMMK